MPLPGKYLISDLLRSFLVPLWGEIARVGQPTAKTVNVVSSPLGLWLHLDNHPYTTYIATEIMTKGVQTQENKLGHT